MADFFTAIGPVLRHEGGWVNNPNDPGGATNFGISLRWLKGQLDLDGHLLGDLDHDGDVDAADIRKMTVNDATRFYHDKWWSPYPYDLLLSQPLANKVFDTTVNMGTVRAFKFLQNAANRLLTTQATVTHTPLLLEDGKFGARTAGVVNQLSINANGLIAVYCQEQSTEYLNLISRNPKLAGFRNNWLHRAAWAG